MDSHSGPKQTLTLNESFRFRSAGEGCFGSRWIVVSSLDFTCALGTTQASEVRFLTAGLDLGTTELYGGKGSLLRAGRERTGDSAGRLDIFIISLFDGSLLVLCLPGPADLPSSGTLSLPQPPWLIGRVESQYTMCLLVGLRAGRCDVGRF